MNIFLIKIFYKKQNKIQMAYAINAYFYGVVISGIY